MKIKPSSYFLIVLLVIAIVALVYGLTFPTMKAKLVPIVISGIILVLASIELVRELRAGVKAQPETEADPEAVLAGTKQEFYRYLVGLGWMAALAAGIYLVGFLIAVPLFVVAYLKLNSRRWLISIGMAAAVAIFIYGIFVVVLRVDLYPGLVFGGYLW